MLNKNREYGIGSISDDRQTNTGDGTIRSVGTEGVLSFTSDNATRLLKVAQRRIMKLGKF